MRILIITAFLLIATMGVSAQDTISVYGRVLPADNTAGYKTGFGVGVDIYSQLNDYLAVQVDVRHEWAAKTYVGDGRDFKLQPMAFYRLPYHFLIGGGVQYGRQWTSQYSKDQLIPIAAIHYNPRREVDTYFEYLFRDRSTFGGGDSNDAKGYRIGYKAVVPLTPKWGVYAHINYQRWSFTQPYGPDAGRYSVNTVTSSLGLSRLLK